MKRCRLSLGSVVLVHTCFLLLAGSAATGQPRLEPLRLGGYDTSGSASGVAVSGSLAYVADLDAGLQIIDVSNPASPVRLGGYDTSGQAFGVSVQGTIAYVADYDAGLQIIDVSNPANCVRLGGYDTSGRAFGVAVAGNRIYVAHGENGLKVFCSLPNVQYMMRVEGGHAGHAVHD